MLSSGNEKCLSVFMLFPHPLRLWILLAEICFCHGTYYYFFLNVGTLVLTACLVRFHHLLYTYLKPILCKWIFFRYLCFFVARCLSILGFRFSFLLFFWYFADTWQETNLLDLFPGGFYLEIRMCMCFHNLILTLLFNESQKEWNISTR